jgi:hypothetical protein
MSNKLFTLIAALLVFSCAARQANHYSSSSLSRNILTAPEIADSFGAFGSSTAYDVITKLRPQFLYRRGCKSLTEEPAVFLNGVRMVGEQKLARIAAMTIALLNITLLWKPRRAMAPESLAA